MFSINDLDVSKACDKSFEFEVKDDLTGKGVGIFISVLGAHCERLAALVREKLNERRTAEAMAKKRDPRGKEIHVDPIEDDVAHYIEQTAIRIVAWRGISDPYSHEAAIKLCTVNPTIKDQIFAVSENLANFPLALPTPLVSTFDKAPT